MLNFYPSWEITGGEDFREERQDVITTWMEYIHISSAVCTHPEKLQVSADPKYCVRTSLIWSSVLLPLLNKIFYKITCKTRLKLRRKAFEGQDSSHSGRGAWPLLGAPNGQGPWWWAARSWRRNSRSAPSLPRRRAVQRFGTTGTCSKRRASSRPSSWETTTGLVPLRTGPASIHAGTYHIVKGVHYYSQVSSSVVDSVATNKHILEGHIFVLTFWIREVLEEKWNGNWKHFSVILLLQLKNAMYLYYIQIWYTQVKPR